MKWVVVPLELEQGQNSPRHHWCSITYMVVVTEHTLAAFAGSVTKAAAGSRLLVALTRMVEVMGSGVTVTVVVEACPQVVTVEETCCADVLVFVCSGDTVSSAGRYLVMQVCLLAIEVEIPPPLGAAAATATSKVVSRVAAVILVEV